MEVTAHLKQITIKKRWKMVQPDCQEVYG